MADPWQEGGPGTLPGGLPAPGPLPPSYANPVPTFGGSPTFASAAANPSLAGPTPYDPNNPQPYVPVTLPNVDPNQQQIMGQEEPIQSLGAASPAGRAAYIGDQLLRGYMQGKTMATARQAVQLARTQQGLSSLYNQASDQYLKLKQAGVDPNSPEMQEAQNQVNAAWNAQMNLWKQHIQGMKLDKNGNPQPQKQNLLQRMFSTQNPEDVLAAWYELMQKTGPPVFHQAAVYDSPAYQARVQAVNQQRAATTQTAATTAQTGQVQAQNQLRVQQLLQKASSDQGITDQEQQELTTLQTGLAAGGKGAASVLNFKPVPNAVPTLNPDTGRYQMSMINERGQTRMIDMPEGFQPNAAALKGVERYELVGGQWRKYQVNGAGVRLEGTEAPLSTAGLNPQVTTTTSQHLDAGSGQLYDTTTTSVRGPAGGTGGAGAGGGTAGGGGASAPHTITTHTAPGSTTPTSVQTDGGPVVAVPSYLVAGMKKAQTTLTEASRVANLANDPNLAHNGTAQETLLYQLLHTSIGRSNETEIRRIMGSAGWGASMDQWFTRARNGEMSPELVRNMVNLVNSNKQAAAKDLQDIVTQAQQAKGRRGAGAGTTAAPPPPASPAGSAASNDWFSNPQNAVPAAGPH